MHGTDQSTSGTFTTPANLPPVVQAPASIAVDHETDLSLNLTDLLAGTTDPDGDSSRITISAMGTPVSGSILSAGGSFIYRPAAGFAGNDDVEIAYMDEDGATTYSALQLTVGGPFGLYPLVPPTIVRYNGLDGDIIYFQSTAVVGKSYLIQRSVDLLEWEDLETVNPAIGAIGFFDEQPPTDKAFYRAKYLGAPATEPRK